MTSNRSSCGNESHANQPHNKGMKLTKPGELRSFAAYPRCYADWSGEAPSPDGLRSTPRYAAATSPAAPGPAPTASCRRSRRCSSRRWITPSSASSTSRLNVSAPTRGGRSSGVPQWPDLGVPRGVPLLASDLLRVMGDDEFEDGLCQIDSDESMVRRGWAPSACLIAGTLALDADRVVGGVHPIK